MVGKAGLMSMRSKPVMWLFSRQHEHCQPWWPLHQLLSVLFWFQILHCSVALFFWLPLTSTQWLLSQPHFTCSSTVIWRYRPSAAYSCVYQACKSPHHKVASIEHGVLACEWPPSSASWSYLCPTCKPGIWRKKTACPAVVDSWLIEIIRLIQLLAQWCGSVLCLRKVVRSTGNLNSEAKIHASASPPSPMMWLLACHLCLFSPRWSCLSQGSRIVLLSVP